MADDTMARWITRKEIRNIKAEAWDQAYKQGREDGAAYENMMQMRDWWGKMPETKNPYRD